MVRGEEHMNGAKISGLGKAVPSLEVTNQMLSEMMDTSDDWIRSRTGIGSRHIAVTETTTELAISAAEAALRESKILKDEIDLVIVATVSPDTMMPSTACQVAKALEIKNAVCFDLAAACSGFIYASEVALNFIKQGNYRNALIIGAEVLSKVVDWKDRGTCVLFADGAGAVVYQGVDENCILGISIGSDGSGSELITLPNPIGDHTFNESDDVKQCISMEGREVYRFATTKVPMHMQETIEKAGLAVEEIDWFVVHQANKRIIDSMAKKLGVDVSKFFINLDTHGNTSAASIPMALNDAKSLFKTGDKIVVSGFGAGLTWGTMIIEWK